MEVSTQKRALGEKKMVMAKTMCVCRFSDVVFFYVVLTAYLSHDPMYETGIDSLSSNLLTPSKTRTEHKIDEWLVRVFVFLFTLHRHQTEVCVPF